jgi:drug/metabolite transporter (DMT)-like permease
MASKLTEGLAAAPEAIGDAVTKVNDCSSGLRRAVAATFIAGAEDTHHLLEGVGHSAQDGLDQSAEAVEKAAKEAKRQVELVMPAIILVVWTASAVALTYHTKWTLSSHGAEFTFPVFYTFVTTTAILFGCTSIMVIQKKTNTVGVTQFREQWKGIFGVAILSILAIWSSDASMMYIGVTLNQLLKACTPFPTMLFGMVIEHKSFTWPMMLAVLLIVVGAGLAVPMEDATGSTYGLIMAGLSTLFAACKISLAARLMSDSANNGLTPLILLFYSSIASVPVLLIWFLATDERSRCPSTSPRTRASRSSCSSSRRSTPSLSTCWVTRSPRSRPPSR